MNPRRQPIPPAPRILWASNRGGQRSCAAHAPPVASPEWWAGMWSLMSEDDQIGFQRANGRPPWCWACRALSELAAHETPDGVGGTA
jgi:hypothetical protein